MVTCCCGKESDKEGFLIFAEYLDSELDRKWDGRVTAIDARVGKRIDK